MSDMEDEVELQIKNETDLGATYILDFRPSES